MAVEVLYTGRISNGTNNWVILALDTNDYLFVGGVDPNYIQLFGKVSGTSGRGRKFIAHKPCLVVAFMPKRQMDPEQFFVEKITFIRTRREGEALTGIRTGATPVTSRMFNILKDTQGACVYYASGEMTFGVHAIKYPDELIIVDETRNLNWGLIIPKGALQLAKGA